MDSDPAFGFVVYYSLLRKSLLGTVSFAPIRCLENRMPFLFAVPILFCFNIKFEECSSAYHHSWVSKWCPYWETGVSLGPLQPWHYFFGKKKWCAFTAPKKMQSTVFWNCLSPDTGAQTVQSNHIALQFGGPSDSNAHKRLQIGGGRGVVPVFYPKNPENVATRKAKKNSIFGWCLGANWRILTPWPCCRNCWKIL